MPEEYDEDEQRNDEGAPGQMLMGKRDSGAIFKDVVQANNWWMRWRQRHQVDHVVPGRCDRNLCLDKPALGSHDTPSWGPQGTRAMGRTYSCILVNNANRKLWVAKHRHLRSERQQPIVSFHLHSTYRPIVEKLRHRSQSHVGENHLSDRRRSLLKFDLRPLVNLKNDHHHSR